MDKVSKKFKFQKKNRAYYKDLESIHNLLVPKEKRILEIGCGTGDLLNGLSPCYGVGVENDEIMVNYAKEKHPNLQIKYANVGNITPKSINEEIPFDIIIINNSLNTVKDVQGLLERLKLFSHKNTRIIISFHNWLWQPLLKIAERVGQRVPQPPESWLTPNDIKNLLDLSGWELIKHGNRFLIPRNIPLLTSFVNRWISQLPVFETLGLTHWMVARLSHREITQTSVSVIIPARNESGNISSAIERMPELGTSTEIIFVEGHSTDNTWEEITRVCESYNGKFSLSKYKQSGKGKADAVWLGFDKAKGDILIILDADLTVKPEDLPRFVKSMQDGSADFINGCRLVYPRTNEAMPILNTMANRFFAIVFSWLLRQRLKDTLCGTKVIWNKDYQDLKKGRSYFGNFDPFGDFDLLFGANKLNLKISEIPIRYQERTYGASNIAHIKEGIILFRMCLVAAKKLRFIK
ncbi:glycosyltransferase [Prochlorococcus sp. MIT 1223]|uniref:glycosyltransferase n=1 Tax=Prochlorococcus sp. MIT 1223 TaxID=3096217 RepID=UPI002A76611C|nr:glycosyltransferase [Prochlorococcus sp. MIT 1223]